MRRGLSDVDDSFMRADAVAPGQSKVESLHDTQSINYYSKRIDLHSELSLSWNIRPADNIDAMSESFIVSEYGTKRPNYADYVSVECSIDLYS